MKIDKSELPQLTHQYDAIPAVLFVGGWARDWFRDGVEPEDVDIMVAGVSEEEMRERKFNEIDSSNNETFGVFQDAFGREVALAREEVSTGDGYRDFDVRPISPDVNPKEAIERDLRRRDITVNAIAFDRAGYLWDLHGGVQDLDDGIIRAVDETAFVQDPLRILRGARFAARLDAVIETETLNLMSAMVEDLPSLPQERVRMEMEKALVQSDKPSRFFDILNSIGALEHTFPELDALRGVPAGPEEYHGEGSAFRHTMMVLDEMNKIRPSDELALLMAVAHDFGKAKTSSEDLPSHPDHGRAGLNPVREMMSRLGLSNEQTSMMKDACRFHTMMHDISDLRESTVLDIVQDADDPARLVSLAQADSLGREPARAFDAGAAFSRFAAATQSMEEWTGARLIENGYSPKEMGGEEFGNLLRQKRVELMRKFED
jgi:tRNA nucleotidyltransferase (CCA-adding enzyme)